MNMPCMSIAIVLPTIYSDISGSVIGSIAVVMTAIHKASSAFHHIMRTNAIVAIPAGAAASKNTPVAISGDRRDNQKYSTIGSTIIITTQYRMIDFQ